MIIFGQQFVTQMRIVGQLASECKAEPLVLLQVMPLKRLGIAGVFTTTSGVANVAYPRSNAASAVSRGTPAR